MASRQQVIQGILDQLGRWKKNVGTLGEMQEGFERGSAEATEDARSVLWKYREAQGLDEPPQFEEQIARSSGLDAIREVADAYLSPKSPMKELGFSDEMLRHRQEQGATIIDDPAFFDRRMLEARQEKGKKLKEMIATAEGIPLDQVGKKGFEFDQDAIDLPDLTSAEYDAVLAGSAEELRRKMREESILKKVGRATGALTADIAEDRTRSLYWLLNAPQAVTSTIADAVVGLTDPNLRTRRTIRANDLMRAQEQGLIRKVGEKPLSEEQKLKIGLGQNVELTDVAGMSPEEFANSSGYGVGDTSWQYNVDNFEPAKPGVRRSFDPEAKEHVFSQRRINPNKIALFGLGGTALATNAGLGLIGTEETGIPFVGRREGYGAAVPSEDDARLSEDGLQEGITRYLLSRDGKLLPKREFLLERPDVSPDQYADYQGYAFSKENDLNPFDDGRVNILNGLAKASTTGIHGPEVQFLGQTLSLNEAIVPILGALAGTAAGGFAPNFRQMRLRKHAQKERLNKRGKLMDYKEPTSFLGKVKANMPVIKRKDYDLVDESGNYDFDGNNANPFIKTGSPLDNITKEYERRFINTNPVTLKGDMNAPAHALSMGIGAGAGLATATGIGLSAEQQRREDNFESWAPPGLDYDAYVATKKDMLDKIKEREKAMTPEEKSSYKYKSERSDSARKQTLMEDMTQQQAKVNKLLTDEQSRREAEKALAIQRSILSEINALEDT